MSNRMPELVPSSFLPRLPRSQSTFEPLPAADLLAHIAVLRELYIPPINGGLVPSDAFYDDEDDEREEVVVRAGRTREEGAARSKLRQFSSGLAESMSGLGLDIPTRQPNGSGSGVARDGELSADELYDNGMIEEEGEEGEDDCLEESSDEEGDNERSTAHLDPFERDWAQKWLEGLFRRAQTWIEEHEPPYDLSESDLGPPAGGDQALRMGDAEAVLRDATAALAMMAGTSAAGSLTRHLLFPVHADLASPVRITRRQLSTNPNLSPETRTFLASLSTSPVSPLLLRRPTLSSPQPPRIAPVNGRRRASTVFSEASDLSSSPDQSTSLPQNIRRRSYSRRRKRRPAVPVLLHDAPMGDHLGVGMQTWGSAILLGREMALRPERFGLTAPPASAQADKGTRGVRVLELGAGTGLLSILCRKLLDLQAAVQTENDRPEASGTNGDGIAGRPDGLVVATDFLPNVLANLKVCVDLNFPSSTEIRIPGQSGSSMSSAGLGSGIHIAKLDWTTFPRYMAVRHQKPNGRRIEPDPKEEEEEEEEEEELSRFSDQPFDLVLASDCVYDPTHAEMLRQVASWVLRLPDADIPGDRGGTFHILSPLRPTFTPELDSIDRYFPRLSTYRAIAQRIEGDGEGLGMDRKLKLGVRGEGKRSVRGRKGEGRVDETLGYWWWEVGWG